MVLELQYTKNQQGGGVKIAIVPFPVNSREGW